MGRILPPKGVFIYLGMSPGIRDFTGVSSIANLSIGALLASLGSIVPFCLPVGHLNPYFVLGTFEVGFY